MPFMTHTHTHVCNRKSFDVVKFCLLDLAFLGSSQYIVCHHIEIFSILSVFTYFFPSLSIFLASYCSLSEKR